MPVHNRFIRNPAGELNPAGLVGIGAFFRVEIHVPPQVAQLLTEQGKPVPPPVVGLALIDTGATMTCVHEPYLVGLGLNPVGRVSAGTAKGPVSAKRICC